MKLGKQVRTLAVLQARMSSSRLPGKVLAELQGAPMLLRQIDRIRRARLLDRLIVATSADAGDDQLATVVAGAGTEVFRGSLDDVLGRFMGAAASVDCQHVVRLTGDCPLADPDVIDAVVAHHFVTDADITTNSVVATFPDGLDVEVMRADALRRAATEASAAFEREHVTQFLYRRPTEFRIVHYKQPRNLSHLRWTVDEPRDLELVRAIYAALFPVNPAFGMHDVLRLLASRPDLAELNVGPERNEGLAKSLAHDQGSSTQEP